jgi:hypothetical protein
MSHGLARRTRPPIRTIVSLALLIFLAAAGRPARAVDASCKPLLDGLLKQIGTPTHIVSTETAAFRGGRTETSEVIYSGGAIYVQLHGRWRKSPLTVEQMRAQQEENQRDAKSMSCAYLRDEAVGGEAAAVYRTHGVTEAGTTDATLWMSKRTGLPLKDEVDLDAGGKLGKSHQTIRYDYANVRPPAGVQ